jgi:PAS domain S-box-containing protein
MLRKKRSGNRLSRRFPQAKRKFQANLEKLFSSVHVGIAYLDREFNYIHVNKAFSDACGLEAEDFYGKNHFIMFPDIASEEIYRNVLKTGQPYHAYGQPLHFVCETQPASIYWDWSLEPVHSSDGEIGHFVLVITDVTAREKAQQALQKTQAMFTHLFESSPDSYILADEDGKIIAVNRSAEGMLGYSRNELIGQPVEALLPEMRRETYASLRSSVLAEPAQPEISSSPKGKILRMEQQARRKDGSLFPAEVTLNPFRTDHHAMILNILRDMSERVARDNEISEQSRLVRLLQDVAVAANEADTVHAAFQFTLDRMCKHLDWPVGRALLTEVDNALHSTGIWCSDLDPRYDAFRQVSETLHFGSGYGLPGLALETGQPVWLNNLSDNTMFHRRIQARQAGIRTGLAIPVLANREVVGVMEFFNINDIPPDPRLLAILPHIGIQLGRVIERKRSEEALRKSAAQLRTIITNLPVILWALDREDRLILLEGKGVAAAGLPTSELIGQKILHRLKNRPEVAALIRRTMRGEDIHAELPTATGSTFDTYLTPYYDENWTIDGVIGLAIDVSERKRMEAELEEMKHRLLENSETERARLGQILHDGPLQDLYGAFYQIQEIKPSLNEYEQEVANRALETIQQVNATLRIIYGELRPSTLIHLGLKKAIRSHGAWLQDRQDKLIIYFDMADDQQQIPNKQRLALFRIYQQLISNTMRHSEARHAWVRLRLNDENVVLEVEDNGKGFDVPGHWIDMVRKDHLGLVGAMERVHGMHGQMEIHSNAGSGTLIRVTVPLSE